MPLTDERYFRMAKRAMFYDRINKQPIEGCYFKINDCKIEDKVDDDPLVIAGETVANAIKKRAFSLSFSASSYRAEQYEQLANAEVTDLNANAAGEVIDLVNYKGDSAIDAATGIASISVDDKTELKEGYYMGVVSAAAKVLIYGFGDRSFQDGTMVQFEDDTYQIGDELTIPGTGGTVDCTELGITFTGGSGTVGMTVDDSFTFFIRRADVVGEQILITGETDFSNIGVMLFPDKYNGEYTVIDCFNFVAAGLGLEIKDTWSSYTISSALLMDETEGGYYRIHRNRPA